VFVRTRFAHDSSSAHGVCLGLRRSRIRVRYEIGRREDRGMVDVRVEGRRERRPFLDDPHPGVRVAVDATLVPLGIPEPAFEIEVVGGELGIVRTDEEARCEALHHCGHGLSRRMSSASELLRQRIELHAALVGGARLGLEECVNSPHVLDALAHLALLVLHLVETAVYAGREALEAAPCGAPFFASVARSSDSRTSRNASAILIPGGSSGPPCVPLRIPRTAAQ
jgi:hypothetical protein